jgi:hypothetical protein
MVNRTLRAADTSAIGIANSPRLGQVCTMSRPVGRTLHSIKRGGRRGKNLVDRDLNARSRRFAPLPPSYQTPPFSQVPLGAQKPYQQQKIRPGIPECSFDLGLHVEGLRLLR